MLASGKNNHNNNHSTQLSPANMSSMHTSHSSQKINNRDLLNSNDQQQQQHSVDHSHHHHHHSGGLHKHSRSSSRDMMSEVEEGSKRNNGGTIIDSFSSSLSIPSMMPNLNGVTATTLENHLPQRLKLSPNSVYVTGCNDHYQLGTMDNEKRFVFCFLSQDDKIKRIKCGQDFTVFLTQKNQVFVLGSNTNGQIGLAKDIHHVKTPARLTAFDEMEVLSLSRSSSLSVAGGQEDTSGSSAASTVQLDDSEELLQKSTSSSSSNSEYGEGQIANVYCGAEFTIFLMRDGRVYGTGSNISGQLGKPISASLENNANIFFEPVPLTMTTPPPAGTATAIVAASHNNGASGFNATNTTTPSATVELSGISKVAVGRTHSIFITEDGHVYACGLNEMGQLGLGTRSRNEPYIQLIQELNDFEIRKAACGAEHSLFLTTTGDLYATGSNQFGQLGISNPQVHFKQSPVLVCQTDSDVTEFNKQNASNSDATTKNDPEATTSTSSVTSKQNNKTAIDQSKNAKNQNGIPELPSGNKSLLGSVKKIKCGLYHSVIMNKHFDIFVFGCNNEGQCGLPFASTTERKLTTTRNIYTPTKLVIMEAGLDYVDRIRCGYKHTTFLTHRYDIYQCGSNELGQLGLPDDEEAIYVSTPTKVTLINDTNIPINATSGPYSTILFTGDDSKPKFSIFKQLKQNHAARDRVFQTNMYAFMPLVRLVSPFLESMLKNSEFMGKLDANDQLYMQRMINTCYDRSEIAFVREMDYILEIIEMKLEQCNNKDKGVLTTCRAKCYAILHELNEKLLENSVAKTDEIEAITSDIRFELFLKQVPEWNKRSNTITWNEERRRQSRVGIDICNPLQHLYDDPFGDIILFLDKAHTKKIKAHKTILSCASAYLAHRIEREEQATSPRSSGYPMTMDMYDATCSSDQINNNNNEKEQAIRIEALECTIKYMYDALDQSSQITQLLVPIMEIAWKFQMKNLQDYCLSSLDANLCVDNFVSVLKWANPYRNSQPLKPIISKIISFGANNWEKIISHFKEDQDWQDVSPALIIRINRQWMQNQERFISNTTTNSTNNIPSLHLVHHHHHHHNQHHHNNQQHSSQSSLKRK
ncbi:hypothetical protein FDP41_002190 [Naegleria fowleri]|uniref:BTB domain-containing protein n=1 Tax=Naegleria fowleri TaxID=5763 RepID=A0A6A5BZW6_NAEFO|nr:uncharacterized protein FDP41_002190 [Naegleria fowleri]KAF0979120.1 hypothetical protein FDP41_002190 [Naegleria fowleri]